MNDFTASNGFRVGPHPTRSMGFAIFDEDGENTLDNSSSHLNTFELDALREYFRAKEDERLGRWRWPENDEYVAYRWSINYINVLYLHDGISTEFRREDVDARRSRSFITDRERVARDWFDAHPEPKPWHDAKPGEVWLLTMMGEELLAEAGKSSDSGTLVFWPITGEPGATPQHNPDVFTAGRRIWPEVSA